MSTSGFHECVLASNLLLRALVRTCTQERMHIQLKMEHSLGQDPTPKLVKS